MKQSHTNRSNFNSGYQDAVAQQSRGYNRIPVMGAIPRDVVAERFVSHAFCPYYYAGYVAGLADVHTGKVNRSSECAWLASNLEHTVPAKTMYHHQTFIMLEPLISKTNCTLSIGPKDASYNGV